MVLDQSDISAPNEVLYGRAGYLYALLFVNTHSTLIEGSLITKVSLMVRSMQYTILVTNEVM